MQNLGLQSSVFDTYQILLKLPDGEIKTASFKDFLVAASTPPAELDYCGSGGVTPQWFAGINKLFTSCPDVNVGIATTDPLHKLHVVGVSYAQKFLAGNSGASSDALINAFVQNDIQDLLRLGVKIGGLDETIYFSINNSGAIDATNVGSATSLTLHNGLGKAVVVYGNNGAKILQLEDNGSLMAREVRVNTNTWPDYVFQDRYKLMSLEETEEYINDNGRLPGVPSAVDVVDNGLNIGEMQVIQMEKMEEIYLHLIDLDKRVQDLEEENAELKKENQNLKNTKQ